MSELGRLRTALRQNASPPPTLSAAQWARLMADPRARIPPRRRPVALMGGVLCLAFLLGSLAIWRARPAHSPAAVRQQDVEAREPGLHQALDDGTTILLDPGASGQVMEARSDYVRFELRRGRALFDVTPNAHRSFHVAASGYDVRVLGTQFTVELSALTQEVRVSVERGSVSVLPPGEAEAVLLGPGDWLDGPRDRPEVHRARPVEPAPAHDVGASAPFTPTSSAAAPTRALRVSSSAASPWLSLYHQGKYGAALAAARAVGFPRLVDELDADDLAALADAARFAGDAPDAILALAALERRFPGMALTGRATFLMGRVFVAQGDHRGALAAFERYLDTYPSGSYSLEALGRLIELYSKQGNRQHAADLARQYLQRAPSGPYARLARSLSGGH
jgi:FecR protein/Tetratricopeptide repeat